MNALSPCPRGHFSWMFPGFLLISPFSWRFLLEIFGTSSEITRRDSPGSCSCGAVSSTHCFIRFQMNGEPQVGATFAVILCPDTTFRDPAGRWRPKISMSHSENGGWRQCRRRKSERLRASRQHGPTLCLLWRPSFVQLLPPANSFPRWDPPRGSESGRPTEDKAPAGWLQRCLPQTSCGRSAESGSLPVSPSCVLSSVGY